MTEDTDAKTLGMRPAPVPAPTRGAGVPGPADGLVAADVVTLRDALDIATGWLDSIQTSPPDTTAARMRAWAEKGMEAIAAVRADATRAAEAEVAGLRAALVDILTEGPNGEYPLDDAMCRAAALLGMEWHDAQDRWVHTEKSRAALAAQPAAPEAEPERFTGQDSWPCVCGHIKRQHHFGDDPARDGSYGPWCQMDPDHCHTFTPAPR